MSAASGFGEVKDLLSNGSTLAEAIMPLTRPKRAEQLALVGDR